MRAGCCESQNQRTPSKAILEMKANKSKGPHSQQALRAIHNYIIYIYGKVPMYMRRPPISRDRALMVNNLGASISACDILKYAILSSCERRMLHNLAPLSQQMGAGPFFISFWNLVLCIYKKLPERAEDKTRIRV